MKRDLKHDRRSDCDRRPIFEPLEGRQLMSTTVAAPSPLRMENVIITSVTQPAQPPPAGVALFPLIG